MNRHVSAFLNIIFLILFFSACKKEKEKPPALEENLAVKMLEKVNALRSAGCQCGADFMPPVQQLKWNAKLELAAKNHAQDMNDRNYFDHLSPDGSIPIQRAQKAGYAGTYVTENIARGYTSVDAVMTAWQKSESHCRAMMDGQHTEMGAARVTNYWVQEFGNP